MLQQWRNLKRKYVAATAILDFQTPGYAERGHMGTYRHRFSPKCATASTRPFSKLGISVENQSLPKSQNQIEVV